MTLAGGDMATATTRQHTAIYYLNEANIDAAANSNLVFTVSGGTTRVTTVWAAVFDYVDQTSPITNSQNYNSIAANATSDIYVFGTALTINNRDQAVLVLSSLRNGNTGFRTISTLPTSFTSVNEQTWGTVDGVRNAILNRTVPTSNTSSNCSTTMSQSSRGSMTGVSFKGCQPATASAGSALTSICKGGSSAALGGSTGGSATGGTWSSSVAGGTFTPNATTLNATYTPPSTYTGTVTLTLTTSGGTCGTATASKTLTVTAPNVATISYAGTPFCKSLTAGQEVTRTGTDGGTYSSTTGLTINASTGAITPSTSTAGTYTVTYTMAAAGGCSAQTATTTVIVNASPTATVSSATLSGCSGDIVSLGGSASGGTGALTYSWSPTTGLSSSSVASPTLTLSSAQTYTLSVTDANGCSSNQPTVAVSIGNTKYWAGAGSGMTGATTGTDFNTAANWSSTTGTKTATTVPSSCDNVNITTTGAVIISISQNTTINDLTILNNGNNTIGFDARTYIFDILGNSTINSNTGGSSSNKISIRVGNAPGKIIFNGTANFGPNAASAPFIGFEGSAAGNTTGMLVFKGDTSFSITVGALTGSIGKFVWDGIGTQTISTNPTYIINFPGDVHVGDTNTPTVEISTVTATGCYVGANKNMTIKSGAILNLKTKYFYPQASGTGTLTIESGARLICGGTINNGSGTNNFPPNFGTYNFNSNSTVEYNATAAQGVNNTPTYGNLTISNNSVKTAAGALTITGKLHINSTATFAASTFTSSVKGNWENNGTFTASASTIQFNGTSEQNILGTSDTTFNNLTVNNSSGVNLSGTADATVNVTLTLTSGLVTPNANLFTLGSSGSISGASSSSYVNGAFNRIITGTLVTSFPIGKGGNYRPVTFNYATSPGTKTVKIEQFESSSPLSISTASTARFGSRYWNISQSATGIAYTVGLNNSGLTPTGTAVILKREGTGSTTQNATSFSNPNYSNTTTFATSNASNDVMLAESSIPLTVTGLTGSNKVYDGNTNATATGTAELSGVVSGDDVTLSGTPTFTFLSANVGTAISISTTGYTLAGANSGCYTLTQPTLSANITLATPTVTVTVGTYTYNASAQGPTAATNTGTGSSYTFSYVGTGETTYAASSTLPTAAGTYTATATVAANGNFGSASSDATSFSITTKDLTITANNATKCFGETYTLENTAFTSSGLQNEETIGSVTLTSSGVSSDAAAASYSIVPSDATGGTFTASNYSINYVNGSLVVNPVSVGGTIAGGATVCSGTNSTELTLSGHTGSVTRWESSLDNFATSGTPIANTTETLTATNLAATTSYRAVVTSGACAAANSATATVTVTPVSVAPTSATASVTTMCGSGSATLTLTGGGGQGATIKWYTSSCGGTLAGTGNNLVVSPTSTTTYYGRYEGSCDTTSCASVTITFISATTTTWNGTTWSNGEPTASTAAIISGTFTSPGTNPNYNLRACKLTVNAGATVLIKSGDTVTLDGALIAASGSFVTFNSGANLIQYGTTNENTGAIIIKRESAPVKRLDYTIWSSPVAAQGLQAFSPNTLSNRFYSYNSSTNLYQAVDPSATNFSPFNSYLVRTANTHPTTPATWTGQFTGVPNNGNYSMAFTGYRLIGNPYPSAIDAENFIDTNIANGSITGTVYFWRKTNGSSNAAYCTYNLGGFVSNNDSAISNMTVNPYSSTNVVQVGQGFIVEGTGTSNVVFTNDMRIDSNVNRFLRTANTIERNRIWLNITNAAGSFSQAMIAYMTGATQGVDPSIDGKLLTDGDVSLASLIGTTSYAIQGRALPFDMTDVVPMSFKVTTAGDYTITIDRVDGLFSNGDQTVYLRDNTTGVLHNLSAGGYTFTSASGTFDTRFEIIYQTTSLAVSTPTFNESQVVIYKTPTNEISINTGNVVMSKVKIFDIRGRLLQEQKDINASQTLMNAGLTTEVLLVQITSEEGIVVTKKVLFPRTSLKLDKKIEVKTQLAEDE